MKRAIAHIPRSYMVKLGTLLGFLLYIFSRPHRRLVRRNLKFCYPRWSRARIRKMSRRIFKNAGITFLEIWQAAFISRQDLLSMLRVDGGQNMVGALRKNKGVIAISAHLANWEVGFLFTGCYFGKPLTGVARHIRFGWLDRWFYRLRTRFGSQIIFKKDALAEMRQTLRRGNLLALTMDQSRYKQAIEINFFGHRATATPAAALLAMRCKSPVIPSFCTRDPDGQLTAHFEPPVVMQKTGDLRTDLQVNTQRIMDAVEDAIRRHPEQWIWFQRPWKKTYPELYPEWTARRRMHKKKKRKRKPVR